ncbi:MAG TPA: hypothetical protein VFD01_19735 [Candidatus Dormibacteraeota bacterium]|nr:hypothetical protein [Candidatus Dormibacteraeota bacterium]
MSPLVVYGTGWLATAALACAVPLPLALELLRRLRRPAARALERRLGLHYRLGGAAAALGVLHGLVSITRAPLPAGAEAGLWLACGAAVALAFAAALGAGLRHLGGAERERARRRHLALFATAVVLGGLHVALNGPLPT